VIAPTDITDALMMLTGNNSALTPQPSEIVIRAWMDYFRDHPQWTGDDLVSAAHSYCRRPRDRMAQPADLGMLIAANYRDAYERADPNTRESAWGELGGHRRDRHGHIDKSAPDDTATSAIGGGPTRNTPRLVAAREALQTCYGERECRPAIREYLDALIEARRTEKVWNAPVDHAKVREAQTVRCQWCKAPTGKPCTSGTGLTPAGGYHPTRLDDARKASTP
jgi:hypothetical protein